MGDMLLDIVAWMSSLSPMWAYSIILCVAWLENVVPPIPGDMVVVFGGYMAGLTLLSPWLVIVLATVGGTLGFMSMYAIWHPRWASGCLDPDRYRWLPKQSNTGCSRTNLASRGYCARCC